MNVLKIKQVQPNPKNQNEKERGENERNSPLLLYPSPFFSSPFCPTITNPFHYPTTPTFPHLPLLPKKPACFKPFRVASLRQPIPATCA